MKIDKHLNLVLTAEKADGTPFYVHSTPISREVFEEYFMVISKTFAAIYSQGLSFLAGPRVAAMLLKSISKEMGVWETVDRGLVAEIRRLTNVIVRSPAGGWETLPLHSAVERGLLDADDQSEVEGAITFFICASAMHKRSLVRQMIEPAAEMWGGQITSLGCTAFAASLQTSTLAESSGGPAGESPVRFSIG